jgi:hypothetical protein
MDAGLDVYGYRDGEKPASRQAMTDRLVLPLLIGCLAFGSIIFVELQLTGTEDPAVAEAAVPPVAAGAGPPGSAVQINNPGVRRRPAQPPQGFPAAPRPSAR